jgi:hypothetical protein
MMEAHHSGDCPLHPASLLYTGLSNVGLCAWQSQEQQESHLKGWQQDRSLCVAICPVESKGDGFLQGGLQHRRQGSLCSDLQQHMSC